MANYRASGHPLIDQAKALHGVLYHASIYPERHPQYAPGRLERAELRARKRLQRRVVKYGERLVVEGRRGRASTQDRPYAVGGRGRRGW